ncbi:MAG: GNAT family N-acetyltransferase [Thermoplasmatales archaeon]|nr:GNAT family N-acetyltransferase [Thermoplasmatales archaeon]
MSDVTIINIDENNISEYPPKCFLNPKNEGYLIKREWLLKHFSDGLIIKQLYTEDEKKCIGFIEYVPGEYAWRAVDAKGYLFIHCLWISPNNYKDKGYGSLLVEECVKDAEKQGKCGVAVLTSEGPFMAGKDLFLKKGFKSVSSVKPSFELMVKTLKRGPKPKFMDWENQLSKYKGLNIIYSNQCPWVARFIDELDEIAKKKDLELKVTELKNAKEAQNAPSVYASFNLVYDGKLLADHYISKTRFLNIINKEIK